MRGLITKKLGMTRVVDQETGKIIPVTVLYAPAATVVGVRTMEKDGYDALVLGSFPRNKKYKNVGKKYQKICEVKLSQPTDATIGSTFGADSFEDRKTVILTSNTKGRGYQGVVKRWGFKTGRESHGSGHYRQPGSVGMCAKPGRILKGKKLPGQYGNHQKTLRGVEIMAIDTNSETIAVRGSVAGARNSFVIIKA